MTRGLTAHQIYNLIQAEPESLQLFDIRSQTPDPQIPGSICVELTLLPYILEQNKSEQLIVLVDENEEESRIALELLKNQYTNLVFLEGGIQEWKKQKLPLKEGQNE